jgi:hypothetical protein
MINPPGKLILMINPKSINPVKEAQAVLLSSPQK